MMPSYGAQYLDLAFDIPYHKINLSVIDVIPVLN